MGCQIHSLTWSRQEIAKPISITIRWQTTWIPLSIPILDAITSRLVFRPILGIESKFTGSSKRSALKTILMKSYMAFNFDSEKAHLQKVDFRVHPYHTLEVDCPYDDSRVIFASPFENLNLMLVLGQRESWPCNDQGFTSYSNCKSTISGLTHRDTLTQ